MSNRHVLSKKKHHRDQDYPCDFGYCTLFLGILLSLIFGGLIWVFLRPFCLHWPQWQDQIDKPLEQKQEEKSKTDQGPQVVTWRTLLPLFMGSGSKTDPLPKQPWLNFATLLLR